MCCTSFDCCVRASGGFWRIVCCSCVVQFQRSLGRRQKSKSDENICRFPVLGPLLRAIVVKFILHVLSPGPELEHVL